MTPKYRNKKEIRYYSKRYDKWVIVPVGYPSDGATWAIDIDSEVWFIHDWLCDHGTWSDGTPCNNKQASQVVYDILKRDGFWFRKYTWRRYTYKFGGGKCRLNPE